MANLEEERDALDPSNAAVVQTITLMRIYDVLMGILTSSDAEAAAKLADFHARGGLITPPPAYDPDLEIE